ncbi:hypothetical protein GYMLUDRAFT_168556 [Collybiopsis luxurians FD-317 M1]|uniref:Acyl-CoA oxidase C-alpha1 domain-containing protein n=1 Tax=Collybiopsis luxurians FD-317 M1 TaxID=944289 RepID=A0A0D0CC42_9AGAR|nr:hypothetical protein GYMLUDRAFT_168556 [Collybiopsis luxurians FD-317 M1]
MRADQLPYSSLFSGSRATEVNLPFEKSVQLSLERAKAIVQSYAFQIEDVLETPSAALWNMHIDPIMLIDGGAATYASIQVNLTAGTLSEYLKGQPYLRKTIEDILAFRVLAHYCLTEVGHGLDAINMETVALALPEGGFDLHTPSESAAKMMPPTSPIGMPSVAIVFAKLQGDKQNYGIRPFVVPLSDGSKLFHGIRTRVLPMRGGSAPVNHSLTYFNHVKLPQSALLGPMNSLPPGAEAERQNFLAVIWRAATGALALGGMGISALERAAYIAGRYSQHRMIGSVANPSPIIQFRTQHTPVLVALAQAMVSKEFWKFSIRMFTDPSVEHRVKHAYAAVFKATVIHHSQTANLELSERLGARGLFQFSDIVSQYNVVRGISIAEGDILGLCIRLVSELLLGRYSLLPSTNPSSLLARHESGVFSELKDLLKQADHHRGDTFNRFILPQCERMVRAIGHRMAFDAAVSAGLDSRVTDLYLASAMKQDAAWYILGAHLTLTDQYIQEDRAIQAALPYLNEWLEATDVGPYVQNPVLSPQHWQSFVEKLPVHEAPRVRASVDFFPARL